MASSVRPAARDRGGVSRGARAAGRMLGSGRPCFSSIDSAHGEGALDELLQVRRAAGRWHVPRYGTRDMYSVACATRRPRAHPKMDSPTSITWTERAEWAFVAMILRAGPMAEASSQRHRTRTGVGKGLPLGRCCHGRKSPKESTLMSENTAPYSAAWFASALDAMDDLVLVKGPRSRLLWANRAFRDYYGMTNDELHSLIDGEQSDPDDTLQYVRDDRRVFVEQTSIDILSEPRHRPPRRDALLSYEEEPDTRRRRSGCHADRRIPGARERCIERRFTGASRARP